MSSTTSSLTINFNQPMPLFPLPGCILLPHATIPLHFFEPRYVQLADDVLAGNSLLCTAMFQGQAWKTNYQDNPPLRPTVCVGYIIQHTKLPGGRYNVLLQGLCRARIIEEVTNPDKLYRSALLEPIATDEPLEMDLSIQRQTMDQLLTDPLLTQLAAVTAINKWLNDQVNTISLIDLGTMTLCEESEVRYQILQEEDAYRRADRFTKLLQSTRKIMHMAQRLSPEELTDQMNLN